MRWVCTAPSRSQWSMQADLTAPTGLQSTLPNPRRPAVPVPAAQLPSPEPRSSGLRRGLPHPYQPRFLLRPATEHLGTVDHEPADSGRLNAQEPNSRSFGRTRSGSWSPTPTTTPWTRSTTRSSKRSSEEAEPQAPDRRHQTAATTPRGAGKATVRCQQQWAALSGQGRMSDRLAQAGATHSPGGLGEWKNPWAIKFPISSGLGFRPRLAQSVM